MASTSSDYITLENDCELVSKAMLLMETKKYYLKRHIKISSQNLYAQYKRLDPDKITRDFSSIQEAEIRIQNLKYLEKLPYLVRKGISLVNTIDLGCGFCSASRLSFVSNYLGIDISLPNKTDIQYRETIGNSSTKSSDIISYVAEVDEKDLYPFGLVILNHVIEHLDDPRIFLESLYKKIRSSTLLIIATPDFDSAMARRYGSKYRMLHDPTHTSLFTTESLGRFLVDIGYNLLEVHFPYFELPVFNSSNLMSLFDSNLHWSPPFYGNHVTYLAAKS